MPYTPEERRMLQSTEVKDIKLDKAGDLTAAIFELQLMYILKHDISYDEIKNSIAAANDANDEVKDRIKRYYEDKCIEKNGDFMQVQKIIDKIDEKFCTVEETLKASEVFDYGRVPVDSTLDEATLEKEYITGHTEHAIKEHVKFKVGDIVLLLDEEGEYPEFDKGVITDVCFSGRTYPYSLESLDGDYIDLFCAEELELVKRGD